jgi:hypothetical protein
MATAAEAAEMVTASAAADMVAAGKHDGALAMNDQVRVFILVRQGPPLRFLELWLTAPVRRFPASSPS